MDRDFFNEYKAQLECVSNEDFMNEFVRRCKSERDGSQRAVYLSMKCAEAVKYRQQK